MGVKQRLEARAEEKQEATTHQQAKEIRIIKYHYKQIEECLDQAEDMKLPTLHYMKSMYGLIQYLINSKFDGGM